MEKQDRKPVVPLKFNHLWLLEDDYRKFLEVAWDLLHPLTYTSFMQQMENNLAKVKSITKTW